MTKDIFEFISEKTIDGEKIALVTVTKTQGSSPASVGQMMAILADGRTCGTVGGGSSEYIITKQAIKALETDDQFFEFDINHAESGMTCGGGMSGFGNIIGGGPHLIVFGGGHVAQSLAPLAIATGFQVAIVEDREELSEHFKDVRYITCNPEDYEKSVKISPSTYIVISTRGHKTDSDALKFSLKYQSRYLGMIGSSKKVATILESLRNEQVPEELINSIYAPIGLDIASSSPAEISVAILAEILLVKNQGTTAHKRDK